MRDAVDAVQSVRPGCGTPIASSAARNERTTRWPSSVGTSSAPSPDLDRAVPSPSRSPSRSSYRPEAQTEGVEPRPEVCARRRSRGRAARRVGPAIRPSPGRRCGSLVRVLVDHEVVGQAPVLQRGVDVLEAVAGDGDDDPAARPPR